MPTIRFRVLTDLAPDRVLNALIDFSDQRPLVWPKIDHGHFRVHGLGPDWADVTEGNALAWERNRYEWNAGSGEVTVRALESDAWAAGSRWQYKLLPTPAGGTRIEVTAVRTPRTLRGWLIAVGLPVLGRRVLKADMEKVLGRLAQRPSTS